MDTDTSGLFAGIFETAIDAIIAIDERGTIESFNPAAERLFGYTAHEAVGLNVRILMPSPDREAHDGYLEKYCRTGKRTIIGSGREVTALRKNGELIPIHLSLSEAQVSGRRVFVGMCRDITELVRARAELQAAHLRADAVLDTAADGILTIDGQGIVQSFNKAAEKLFGYTKLEMVGQNVKRLMPASTAAHHGDYLKQALQTEEPKATGVGREVLARRRDGTTFPAWLSVSRFRIERADFFTGIVRDISELRQKESELQDVNRQLSYRGWFSERQLELNNVVRGASNLAEACQLLTDTLAKQTQAVSAVGYLAEEPACKRLVVAAGHAFPSANKPGNSVELGEGLLGQAVREGSTRFVNLESGQFVIVSAFGHFTPRYLAIVPLVYNDVSVGAFELALESAPEAREMRYLESLPALCGAILGAIRDQERIRELLAQSRAQTEELRAQQEETAAAKEQLEEQKVRLEGINSALLHARAELEEKAGALQKTGRYKSEFLTNMSHELRTPLNSVLVLAKVLLENRSGNLTPEQKESLRVIAESGKNLLDLINDILDLSKVEAGELRFAPANVSIPELLSNLQGMFRPLMDAKSLNFSCVQTEGIPSHLYTDPLRLTQVLRNLLSNATKFTERGSVTLTVSLLGSERPVQRSGLCPGDALVFEVEDTGIGIAAEEHELIFQAFQQVDSTLNRRFGGTGLGLSISSNLAERLGGELQLHSIEGVGSRFALILPQRYESTGASASQTQSAERDDLLPSTRTTGSKGTLPPPALEAEPACVPKTRKDGSKCGGSTAALDRILEGKTVLIVDDDLRNVFALRALLGSVGMHVVVAENGMEAIEQFAKRTDIDCVLMDILMPHMDGYAAIGRLRALPHGAQIPIVALTAKTMPTDRQQCLEAGATDYLSKPTNKDALLGCLRVWLTT